MITYGLEQLIQSGKARQHTFTYGAGGVGRIPCPKNSFIIIHHFDYWHFIDLPDSEGDNPAVGFVSFQVLAAQGVFPCLFDFGIIGNFVANVDPGNAALTLANVTAGLNAIAPGWIVMYALIPPPPGQFSAQFTFTTTSPGAAFNGILPTMTPQVPLPVFLSGSGFFVGGTAAAITSDAFLQHSVHQLEFRSTKGRNHFVIQEPVNIFSWSLIAGNDPTLFFANCGGYYSKDTYLVHTQDIQINVLAVPDVDNWAVTYTQLNSESQEVNKPSGYGQGAAGNLTTREVLFDGAGGTQQYLPLTSLFDNTALIPGEYRQEFKVDGNFQNQLFNPKNKRGIQGKFPTYPLVNIDYIQVDMNYNEFVKASNG